MRRDIKTDCLFQLYLRKIAHRMMQLHDERLAPFDITNQQARIVGIIGTHQENGDMICQKDLEAEMDRKGSSITSLLQGLERKGFIQRCTGADERTKQLSLLPKGQELIELFNGVFHETEDRLVFGMTEEQKAEFLQLLQIATENLG
jgi:DNA-binding MarR family transcriptional regulator